MNVLLNITEFNRIDTMTLPPFAAGSVPPNTSFSTASPSVSSFMSRITPYSSSIPTIEPNCTLDSASLRLPLAVFYSLFFVLGLVGNLFALWVFLFLHSKHNSVRVFLINCAVADLVLLACLPFRVFYHFNGDHWELGTVACRLVGNGFYMNMYTSILLLGLISLDRYVRLRGRGRARSLWGRLCGHKQLWSWVVCGTIWSIFLMGTLLMVVTKEDKDSNNQCFEYRQRRNVTWKAYVNAMLVVLFWLVFIMMVISHAKIASKLLQLSQKKPELPNASKYKRTAKKSFFVLFLFTVCFAPYHIFRPVYIQSQINSGSCTYLGMVNHINEIMLLLSTFNSCLDPVMYFLLSGSVRRTALRVLGHRLCNRCQYLQDVTLNSSTIDYRRGSAPLAIPGQILNNPSLTPRTSFCVVNTTLRRTEATTTLPPAGLQ